MAVVIGQSEEIELADHLARIAPNERQTEYRQHIVELINKNTLKVRAYIGVSLVGKSTDWNRKQ